MNFRVVKAHSTTVPFRFEKQANYQHSTYIYFRVSLLSSNTTALTAAIVNTGASHNNLHISSYTIDSHRNEIQIKFGYIVISTTSYISAEHTHTPADFNRWQRMNYYDESPPLAFVSRSCYCTKRLYKLTKKSNNSLPWDTIGFCRAKMSKKRSR